MKKAILHVLTYGAVLTLALSLLAWILSQGPEGIPTFLQGGGAGAADWSSIAQQVLAKNASLPLVGLLIQMLVILTLSRACAGVLKFFGQPPVVGEMIAGLLLGKSVFALLWPAGFSFIFPDRSMPQLYFFSQIGLIFFMFLVGLDLRLSNLKDRAAAAIAISHSSILLPFLLGALLSLGLYAHFGSAHVAFSSFALFMGIAMSITAFPVLARIIQDKQLGGTALGSMAIACAAVDDVTAWCLLAAVLGIVKAGSMHSALVVLSVAAIYVLFMLKVVRPLALSVLRPATVEGKFSSAQLAFIFCVGLGSALLSEVIGIHALFGAFLAGAIMPHHVSFRTSLSAKIEDLTTVVLLPIFFAYTGIRAQVSLLDSWQAWLACAVIIIVATVGKMLGAAFAARATGVKWSESWALGILMNTRGLMELVVLNIGYDIGILSPQIFAMMVVMAITTTFMTGPLLSLCLPELRQKRVDALKVLAT
ncbi:cation:proton antiporter [Paludibacterium purpuratum]|uniref:cation:proton antiporter domain-containing protein n=1 Tax=Paludibacterium purpuratum TaxID=1144873 RepID=UPI001414D55A|nr:cation:proton antiporter [Paludibacterium purpuratum]